ncbi:MAG TPA: hypothetical protein VEN81_05510 [Planctomycetota bacterium]|nr:hypothetical protein [Planctomycetota bacterium]
MAMMLRPPKGGAWLSVEEVLQRLKKEFTRVEVVLGSTADYALSVAKSWRDAGQTARADRLEAVKDQGATVGVVEGGPQFAMILMVLPEFPIMAGFQSEAQLESMQPLLQRCATVLGYDLK